MKPLLAVSIAGLSMLAALNAGAAEIFRCRTAGGGLSYQELACPPGSDAGKVEVPSLFPDVDYAARERLLQRAAAVDQRLEAERERLSREEMTRITARAHVAAAHAAAPAAPETVYVHGWGWPMRSAHRPLRTHRHSGRLLR